MEIKIFNTKKRSFKKLSDYEEEEDARKITRKSMKEIERFETEIKEISKSIKKTI